MSTLLSDYQVGNDFIARDILLGIVDRHEKEDKKGPYVYLHLNEQGRTFEGNVVDLQGGTVLLKVGTSLQFVDLDRIVAVVLRTRI